MAQNVGTETTTYVRNIYKYYLAYKLMDEQGLLQNASDQAPAAKGKTAHNSAATNMSRQISAAHFSV